ncbi:hypothetical protein HRbin12_00854 [bacterium HR12]|nr:hypothetical protein HRbin12_00854 [bacterium HR12]
MPVEEVPEPLQVPGLGQDHPAVHEDRLQDHPGHAVALVGEDALDRREVVVGDHPERLGVGGRHADRVRHRHRPVRRPGLRDVDPVRERQAVGAAVVRALDLDDEVATGRRPHDPAGVHRGLRARVLEPPERQPEALGEELGDDHGVLDRHGEVRPERHAPAHRLDDLGVRVAHDHHPVAGVQVDVAVPVEVDDVRALAPVPVEDHRLQRVPAARHPAGERALRPLGEGHLARRPLPQARLLLGDQLLDLGGIDLAHAPNLLGADGAKHRAAVKPPRARAGRPGSRPTPA